MNHSPANKQRVLENMPASIFPRFNLNRMPGIADAKLLPMFSALTGMSPDCAIPAYLRVDANLFFTNIAVFRGMLLQRLLWPQLLPRCSWLPRPLRPECLPRSARNHPANRVCLRSRRLSISSWSQGNIKPLTTIRPHNYRSR